MSIKRNSGEQEEEHVHAWYQTGVLGEQKCKCKKVLISAPEEARRIDEWNSYRDLVKTTDIYQDFQIMKQAFMSNDKELMKETDAVVMSRNHEVVNDWGDTTIERNDPGSLLPKPNFPDPSTWNGYVII